MRNRCVPRTGNACTRGATKCQSLAIVVEVVPEDGGELDADRANGECFLDRLGGLGPLVEIVKEREQRAAAAAHTYNAGEAAFDSRAQFAQFRAKGKGGGFEVVGEQGQ